MRCNMMRMMMMMMMTIVVTLAVTLFIFNNALRAFISAV